MNVVNEQAWCFAPKIKHDLISKNSLFQSLLFLINAKIVKEPIFLD